MDVLPSDDAYCGATPTECGPQERDASGPGLTYVLRYGNRDLWKIGWCKDLADRLREVNDHVPYEVIGEQWTVAMHEGRTTCLSAYEREQALLGLLDPHRTVGERVACPDHVLQAAWAATRRGFEPPQVG